MTLKSPGIDNCQSWFLSFGCRLSAVVARRRRRRQFGVINAPLKRKVAHLRAAPSSAQFSSVVGEEVRVRKLGDVEEEKLGRQLLLGRPAGIQSHLSSISIIGRPSSSVIMHADGTRVHLFGRRRLKLNTASPATRDGRDCGERTGCLIWR